jgi:hypothetical protein
MDDVLCVCKNQFLCEDIGVISPVRDLLILKKNSDMFISIGRSGMMSTLTVKMLIAAYARSIQQ